MKEQKACTHLVDGHIFKNLRTEALERGLVIRDEWKRALKLARVRYRSPYQTRRHTYAGMTLTLSESPMRVAQQMGHKDWTMIARIYGK